MTSTSLVDRSILVTRSTDAGAAFRVLLESRGARAVELPMIAITDPSSWEECDRSIRALGSYHGVFFTSRNAVDFFLKRIRLIDASHMTELAERQVYAVGEKTEEALRQAGLPVLPVPRRYSSADLAAMLNRHRVWEKRFLFPKSNIARETLPDHVRSLGGSVDEIVVYENRMPSPGDVDPVRKALLKGSIAASTFFSPSSVHNASELIGREPLAHAPIAVIGPTTAEAVREAGLSPRIIARRSTAEALIESLEEFFAGRASLR